MTNNSEDPFEKIGNGFLFQDSGEELVSEPPKKKPKRRKRGSNRNFWIAAGVLTVLFIIMVAVLSVLTLSVSPKLQAARLEQAALINAHNTATVRAATNASISGLQISTNTPSPTVTSMPTSTPMIILFTDTAEPTATEESGIGIVMNDPGMTATAAVLLTQAAAQQTVVTPTATSTALPQTGLAENIGMPGLLGIALALIFVMILTRRVRLSA